MQPGPNKNTRSEPIDSIHSSMGNDSSKMMKEGAINNMNNQQGVAFNDRSYNGNGEASMISDDQQSEDETCNISHIEENDDAESHATTTEPTGAEDEKKTAAGAKPSSEPSNSGDASMPKEDAEEEEKKSALPPRETATEEPTKVVAGEGFLITGVDQQPKTREDLPVTKDDSTKDNHEDIPVKLIIKEDEGKEDNLPQEDKPLAVAEAPAEDKNSLQQEQPGEARNSSCPSPEPTKKMDEEEGNSSACPSPERTKKIDQEEADLQPEVDNSSSCPSPEPTKKMDDQEEDDLPSSAKKADQKKEKGCPRAKKIPLHRLMVDYRERKVEEKERKQQDLEDRLKDSRKSCRPKKTPDKFVAEPATCFMNPLAFKKRKKKMMLKKSSLNKRRKLELSEEALSPEQQPEQPSPEQVPSNGDSKLPAVSKHDFMPAEVLSSPSFPETPTSSSIVPVPPPRKMADAVMDHYNHHQDAEDRHSDAASARVVEVMPTLKKSYIKHVFAGFIPTDDYLTKPFPEQLMALLTSGQASEAICWLPGSSFAVDPRYFPEWVIERFFPQCHSRDITYALRRWGFENTKTDVKLPSGVVAFRHYLFIRNRPYLAKCMTFPKMKPKNLDRDLTTSRAAAASAATVKPTDQRPPDKQFQRKRLTDMSGGRRSFLMRNLRPDNSSRGDAMLRGEGREVGGTSQDLKSSTTANTASRDPYSPRIAPVILDRNLGSFTGSYVARSIDRPMPPPKTVKQSGEKRNRGICAEGSALATGLSRIDWSDETDANGNPYRGVPGMNQSRREHQRLEAQDYPDEPDTDDQRYGAEYGIEALAARMRSKIPLSRSTQPYRRNSVKLPLQRKGGAAKCIGSPKSVNVAKSSGRRHEGSAPSSQHEKDRRVQTMIANQKNSDPSRAAAARAVHCGAYRQPQPARQIAPRQQQQQPQHRQQSQHRPLQSAPRHLVRKPPPPPPAPKMTLETLRLQHIEEERAAKRQKLLAQQMAAQANTKPSPSGVAATNPPTQQPQSMTLDAFRASQDRQQQQGVMRQEAMHQNKLREQMRVEAQRAAAAAAEDEEAARRRRLREALYGSNKPAPPKPAPKPATVKQEQPAAVKPSSPSPSNSQAKTGQDPSTRRASNVSASGLSSSASVTSTGHHPRPAISSPSAIRTPAVANFAAALQTATPGPNGMLHIPATAAASLGMPELNSLLIMQQQQQQQQQMLHQRNLAALVMGSATGFQTPEQLLSQMNPSQAQAYAMQYEQLMQLHRMHQR